MPLNRRHCLAAPLAALGVGDAHASITLEAGARDAELPFDRVDNRLLVPAQLPGLPPLRLVFDTGGSNILDLEVAQRAGLELTDRFEMPGAGEGTLPAWRTRVEQLRLGAVRMRRVPFVVLPLGAIRRAIGFPQLHGLVGRELLQRFAVHVQPAEGRLRLAEQAQVPAGATVLPIDFSAGLPSLPARLDGRPLRLVVDSGDRSSLTLFGPFIDAHGLRSAYGPALRAVTGWGVGGPLRADVVRSCLLELGTLRVADLVARLPLDTRGAFAGRTADASLGNGVLLRFEHGFDYAGRRLWLRPLPGHDRPDGADRSGCWLALHEAGFEVVDVLPQGPAEQAGLRTGDVVTAVDGVPASALVLPQLRERWRDDDGPASALLRLAGGAERQLRLRTLLPARRC